MCHNKMMGKKHHLSIKIFFFKAPSFFSFLLLLFFVLLWHTKRHSVGKVCRMDYRYDRKGGEPGPIFYTIFLLECLVAPVVRALYHLFPSSWLTLKGGAFCLEKKNFSMASLLLFTWKFPPHFLLSASVKWTGRKKVCDTTLLCISEIVEQQQQQKQ